MKILLFVFLSLMIIEPTFAQSLANPAIGMSASLGSQAARQYLSGKSDESLALYQKAIAKSESEYGKSSRVTADLYYQLGVRAFWLSRFDLAERSFKKAVEINPNSEAAQLMLVNLLRFRNRDAEAYAHIQQGLKKHPDSTPLRKDLVICLQERDPSRATEQAFLVNCMQNGLTEKIPAPKQEPIAAPKKVEQKEAVEKINTNKNPPKQENLANKKSKDSTNKVNSPKQAPQTASKAIYEPVSKVNQNAAPTIIKKRSKAASHKHANTMPAGLVPPPPPAEAFGFPTIRHAGMKAQAGSIKLENAQPAHNEATEPPKKHTVEHSAAEADPDFLIEWASVKKKHAPTK